jgi:hypothetical protein
VRPLPGGPKPALRLGAAALRARSALAVTTASTVYSARHPAGLLHPASGHGVRCVSALLPAPRPKARGRSLGFLYSALPFGAFPFAAGRGASPRPDALSPSFPGSGLVPPVLPRAEVHAFRRSLDLKALLHCEVRCTLPTLPSASCSLLPWACSQARPRCRYSPSRVPKGARACAPKGAGWLARAARRPLGLPTGSGGSSPCPKVRRGRLRGLAWSGTVAPKGSVPPASDSVGRPRRAGLAGRRAAPPEGGRAAGTQAGAEPEGPGPLWVGRGLAPEGACPWLLRCSGEPRRCRTRSPRSASARCAPARGSVEFGCTSGSRRSRRALPPAPEGAVGAGRVYAPRRARTRRGCHLPPKGKGPAPPEGGRHLGVPPLVPKDQGPSGPAEPRRALVSRGTREPRRALELARASPPSPKGGRLRPAWRFGRGAPKSPSSSACGAGSDHFLGIVLHRSAAMVRLGWGAVRPAGRSQRFSRAPTRGPPAPKRRASRRSGVAAVPGHAGSGPSSHGRHRSADTAGRSPWSPRRRYPRVPVLPWPATPRPLSAALARAVARAEARARLAPWLPSLVGGDPC